MIYAVILAGGTGKRMGNNDIPKQFLKIGGKPVLVHTVEKFDLFPEFKKIVVLTPKQWMNQTSDMLSRELPDMSRIIVAEGGQTRNETIMNAISAIDSIDGLTDETIIVTHDAVRPFVTYRIIKENIEEAKRTGACDTAFPASDTLIQTKDNRYICDIPDRNEMMQGQTPQSFNAKRLRELYLSLSDEDRRKLTDAAKIFIISGEPVSIVKGESFNIKITYPHDIEMAEAILKRDVK